MRDVPSGAVGSALAALSYWVVERREIQTGDISSARACTFIFLSAVNSQQCGLPFSVHNLFARCCCNHYAYHLSSLHTDLCFANTIKDLGQGCWLLDMDMAKCSILEMLQRVFGRGHTGPAFLLRAIVGGGPIFHLWTESTWQGAGTVILQQCMYCEIVTLQRSAKVGAPGLVNF